jgi:threonine/homoserine/homoserine lactone efflux protein
MTLATAIAFAIAMFFLAIVPGPGVAAIVSRTLGSGMNAGLAVITGLAVGDTVFLVLAIGGLSAVASVIGPLFQAVKYVGAAYLIWLGYKALTAKAAPIDIAPATTMSPWRETSIGLLVTLGNPKPILFYGALMPTFVDITKVGVGDVGVLVTIVVTVSYIVLGGYAYLAHRARTLLTSRSAVGRLNKVTGGLLIGSAIMVATR